MRSDRAAAADFTPAVDSGSRSDPARHPAFILSTKTLRNLRFRGCNVEPGRGILRAMPSLRALPVPALPPAPPSDRLRVAALPGAVAVLAIGLLVTSLLVWSTGSADRAAIERQRGIVTGLLDREIEGIAHQQESSTVWDDAVVHLKGPLDPDWIDSNVGIWMNMYFGHDRVLVLDDRDRPIYASRGAGRSTPADYGLVAEAARPLIARLRAILAAGRWTSRDPGNRSPGAEDLAVVDGHPAIVSVKPVMPWGGTLKQEPGTEYLHISVRYLDGSFITDLRDRFAFDGARFSDAVPAGAGEHAVPLQDAKGRVLGYFVWTPFRPGQVVLIHLAPVLALVLGGIVAVVAVLVARLRRGARALAASEALARHVAFHDPLTGLPNRALFSDRLDALAAAGRDFAVLLIDLDRFKAVNDGFGHHAGDAVLCGVCDRIRDELAPGATLARLGGDEFGVLLPEVADRADASATSERLVRAACRPLAVEGRMLAVGASIGVALWPEDGRSGEALCRQADVALYGMKARQRDVTPGGAAASRAA
jgi:diguanylate cyclase (GGDEF)-like protein